MRSRMCLKLLLSLILLWPGACFAPDDTITPISTSQNVLSTAYRARQSPLGGGLERLGAFHVLARWSTDEASRRELRRLIYLAVEREREDRPRRYAVSLMAMPDLIDAQTVP